MIVKTEQLESGIQVKKQQAASNPPAEEEGMTQIQWASGGINFPHTLPPYCVVLHH